MSVYELVAGNRAAPTATRASFRPVLMSCLIVLGMILWHARGFMEAEDAAVYFGYFNNSSSVTVPYYYTGYIALYTEIVSYVASFLALPLQPLIFGIGASVIGVYFTYQLLVFLQDTLKAPVLSIILAVLVIALVIKTTGTFNLFTNLTYNIWIGWMGLYLRVLNGMRGRPAGAATIVLGVLSAWSHSFCIVLIVPIIAAMLLRPQRNVRIVAELGLYVVAAGLFIVFFIEPGFPLPIDKSRLTAKLVQMALDIHSNMLVLIAISALLLASAIPASIRNLGALFRRRQASLDDLLLSVLAFVGLTTVMIIVASGRLLISDKIWARYLYAPFLSLFLAAIILGLQTATFRGWVAEFESRMQRLLGNPGIALTAAIGLVACLTISQVAVWGTVSSNITRMVDGERFLIAADQYRATCTDGALIKEWDKWSLAVLCHRKELTASSEALPFSDSHVAVWSTDGTTATSDHERLDVPMLFQPLDTLKLPRF